MFVSIIIAKLIIIVILLFLFNLKLCFKIENLLISVRSLINLKMYIKYKKKFRKSYKKHLHEALADRVAHL